MHIATCPKTYSKDQDKAYSPEETIRKVQTQLQSLDIAILGTLQRIDTGRLGIPVYLSTCAADSKEVMPTRKQMGKGASPEQAKASALMELMERYGFFTFWERKPNVFSGTWDEAKKQFGKALIPLDELCKACHNEELDSTIAQYILNLRQWLFFPVMRVTDGAIVYLPLDLFKELGEFNGSSAGNADAESILQGACELVERHVCCIADQTHPTLPTIDLFSCDDPVLKKLIKRFTTNGITLLLKDFSLDMPVPTVAALAYDRTTFPHLSEIVFTAGTASTPVKAAIRAITEVAQLAGDFCTNACYEASGLSKYTTLKDITWLLRGSLVTLNSLPSIEKDDITIELLSLAHTLSQQNFTMYTISTTNPTTRIPSHYTIIPGFCFRERDNNASLGLFTGKLIAEEDDFDSAMNKLMLLKKVQPNAHYSIFFKGLVYLRHHDFINAFHAFKKAESLQPDTNTKALVAFYAGYALTLANDWEKALPYLQRSADLCPEMKEYLNLRGVAYFKMADYESARKDFLTVVSSLDKGSVMDLMNLGICYKFQGNIDKARHYLTVALEIDPTLKSAQKELAELPTEL